MSPQMQRMMEPIPLMVNEVHLEAILQIIIIGMLMLMLETV